MTVDELVQGRLPALDLDSLYGRGPAGEDLEFYADGIQLEMGRTTATPFPDHRTNVDRDGSDLPCVGFGSLESERRKALIPDERNDENLAVTQIHPAFIQTSDETVLLERARMLFVRETGDGLPLLSLLRWRLRGQYRVRLTAPGLDPAWPTAEPAGVASSLRSSVRR